MEIGPAPGSPVVRPMCKDTRRPRAKQSVGGCGGACDSGFCVVVEMESGGLWVGLD